VSICLLTSSNDDLFICSGGNKRKLSTAIALVGSPIIVFLVSNVFFGFCSK